MYYCSLILIVPLFCLIPITLSLRKLNNLAWSISVIVMPKGTASRILVMGGVHLQDGDNCTIVPCSTRTGSILPLSEGNPTAVAVVRKYEIGRELLLGRASQTQPSSNSKVWSRKNNSFSANIMIGST